MHNKLIKDGKEHNLIREIKEPDKTLSYRISTPYEDEPSQAHYKSGLQAVVEFFELFCQNADKVEYIFYNLFEKLGIKTGKTKTQFTAMHYRTYQSKVIDSAGVREMIEEVRKFSSESEDLKLFYQKIDEI